MAQHPALPVGIDTVTADCSGATTTASGTTSVSVTACTPPLVVVSGADQTAAPGTAYALPLVVEVTCGGSPDPGVTVTFVPPSSSPTGTVSPASSVTNSAGDASTNVTAGTTPGNWSLGVAITGGPGLAGGVPFIIASTACSPTTGSGSCVITGTAT